MAEENKQVEEVKGLVATLRSEFEKMEKGKVTASDFKTFQEKITADVGDIQTKMNRSPVAGQAEEKGDGIKPEIKALAKYMRKGILEPEEAKLLQVSDQTLGGYLAPPEYVRELLKGLVLFSPIRSIARVRSTSQESMELPKKTGASTARWGGELVTKTETTGIAFGIEKITPQETYSLYKITKKMIEDSLFNIETEVQMDASEQQGKLEGTAFVSGTGVDQPEGFLSNAAVIAAKVAGAGGSGALGVADIFSTFYSVPALYAANGSWVMNRLSEKACMLLKDTNNFYLWMPSLATGQPSTLLGRPIVSCPDMPNIGSNAYAVAFGDFSKAYTIVDRIQTEVQRLTELYAESGQVGVIVRRRVGGQVTLAEAIRVLQIQS